MDVLIFDDDTHFAELLAAMVQEDGWTVEKHYHAMGAVDVIRRVKPRVLILDIMMPGMDGLSLCKAVKSLPETAAIPVFILSAKGFEEEKSEAERVGALAFMSKTDDIEKLRQRLKELLGPNGQAALLPTGLPGMPQTPVFFAQIWGFRGPVGGDPAIQPTNCVTLDLGGRTVILDAGTGLRFFVESRQPLQGDLWVLLSGHGGEQISGIANLAALQFPGRVHIGGTSDTRRPFKTLIQNSLGNRFDMSRLSLYTLVEGRFNMWPDVAVQALFSNHPGATLAFRIFHKGRSLVYCPANSIGTGKSLSDFNEKFLQFIRGAEVLIHDARYRHADLAAHAGEGHSSSKLIAEAASREGVRDLVLFGLDINYTREQCQEILDETRGELAKQHSSLQVQLAKTGLQIGV